MAKERRSLLTNQSKAAAPADYFVESSLGARCTFRYYLAPRCGPPRTRPARDAFLSIRSFVVNLLRRRFAASCALASRLHLRRFLAVARQLGCEPHARQRFCLAAADVIGLSRHAAFSR